MRTVAEAIDQIATAYDELDKYAFVAEELGTAPVELIDVMRTLRVPMIKAPPEVGGDHLLLADQQRYFESLSYANPTAGWIGFNHAGAAGKCGSMLSEEGCEAVFGPTGSPFIAAVAAPSGTFEVVEGGIQVTGTYKFASGIQHAEWLMVPAIEAAKRPSMRMAVVNASDFGTEGDWKVMALRGTGSVDAVLDKAFVPQHLTADVFAPPARGGPMYSLGYQTYVAGENLGFTLGVCQRFMDEVARYATTKSRGSDGRLADRGAFQYELGKGQLQVNAARAYGAKTLAEADGVCVANNGLTKTEEQQVVAMMAFSTESATKAVSHLFHFAGAGALFEDSVLQRCFRDVHGSSQHHVASNVVYDRFGQSLLAAAETAFLETKDL